MWTGVMSRSYYSLTVRGASEQRNSHEYFLKLIEGPTLIFTQWTVIYNGRDHRDIHQGLQTVPSVDKVVFAFQHLGQFKGHSQAMVKPQYSELNLLNRIHMHYVAFSTCSQNPTTPHPTYLKQEGLLKIGQHRNVEISGAHKGPFINIHEGILGFPTVG